MIQSRNKYLQFMLVLLAAWAIAWGAMFVMGQAVLLYGLGKNAMFFSQGFQAGNLDFSATSNGVGCHINDRLSDCH